MGRVRAVLDFAVDVVYPKRCAGCDRRGVWLCPDCDGALPRYSRPWCPHCGVPESYARCACPSLPEQLAMVRSVGPFAGWLREAIHRLKYHGEWARADDLGGLLADAIVDLPRCDLVLPVPLHPSRRKLRGFNQSALLAEAIGRSHSLAVGNVLIRTRRTHAQVDLHAAARATNVAGAFAVAGNVALTGKSVLIVDDVITTGATLAACTDALREAGAETVAAATLARDL